MMHNPRKAFAEEAARRNFADYVQHVAFNLTLSRAMITTLGLVRDYGWPLNTEDGGLDENFSTVRGALRLVHTGGADNFVGHYRALERRGLTYFAPSPDWKELQAMPSAERRAA